MTAVVGFILGLLAGIVLTVCVILALIDYATRD